MVAIESPGAPATTGAAGVVGWRLEHISLTRAAGDHRAARSLEFHPHLNVVTSEGNLAEVAARLAAAVHGAESGVHAELSVTGGPSLVVFRPVGGRPRLVDIDAQRECPWDDTLATLAPMTTPAEGARQPEAGQSWTPSEAVEVVGQLARVDQLVLWSAAKRLAAARDAAHGDPHAEQAATTATPPPTKLGLFRRRAKAAAPSAPPSPTQELVEADRYWRLFAGPVSVELALQQRKRVEIASSLLVRLGALAAVGGIEQPGDSPPVEALGPAQVPELVCALVPERRDGAGPHLVTVPGDAEPEAASLVLEQLAHLGSDRQLIIVTSADAIIEWARLESHVRRAGLLELTD